MLAGFVGAGLLAGLAAGAPAAELSLEGNRLLVNGMLDGSSLKDFEAQLASGQVHTVVFTNSMGGSPEVAADYARAIQASGVNTEALGQCQAACAFAFLAGKEHRFGHGFQVHALLIPIGEKPQPGELAGRWQGSGASRTLAEFAGPGADTGAPAAGTAPMPAPTPTSVAATAAVTPVAAGNVPAGTLVASNAGTAAPAVVPPVTPVAAGAAPPHERWQPNQGVLFTSTPTLFGRVNGSFYCDGTQGRDMSRCEALPDADPYKLGVLTP